MGVTISCPKCHAPIPKEGLVPGQAIACTQCGASIRFKSKPAPPKPSPPPPEVASGPFGVDPAPFAGIDPSSVGEYDLAEPIDVPRPIAPRHVVAPARAPEPEASRKPARKPSKKKQAQSNRVPLIAGGVAGSLVLVGIIVAATQWTGGKGPAPPGAAVAGRAAGQDGATAGARVPVSHSFEAATSTTLPRNKEAKLAGALYAFKPAPAAEGVPSTKATHPRWKRQVASDRAFEEFPDGDGVPVPIGPPPEPIAFPPGIFMPLGRAPSPPGMRAGPLFSPDHRYLVAATYTGPAFKHDPSRPGQVIYLPLEPYPHALYDMTTGKRLAEFAAAMPLSLDGRLSPGGEYAVTRAWDEMPDLGKAKTFPLNIWKKGQPKPAGTIAPTGIVRWAEFVSPTRVALFQLEPDPALVVWDVESRTVATRIPATIRRPGTQERDAAAQLGRQERPTGDDLGAYRPNPTGGAVAPGGRFIAIGGPLDVTVFDLQEGKEHGRFPVRRNAGIMDYKAIAFLAKPDRLVVDVDWNTTAWDLATGKVVASQSRPGPSPPGGSYEIGPKGQIEYVTRRFAGINTGGAPLGKPATETGLFLCMSNDRSPAPPEIQNKITHELSELDLLFTWNLDPKTSVRNEIPAFEPFKTIADRPAVSPGKREGLVATKPQPPATWQAPPASDWTKPAAAGWLPDWPSALTDTQGAVIRYEPVEHKVRQYGKRQTYFRMSWDRHDLATGKPVGPPLPLWPWDNDPRVLSDDPNARTPTPPESTTAALTSDGESLALVDPNEPHRVDIWDTKGNRTGFYAVPEGDVIEWLGWSSDGKLLALAAGSLTAWDAKAGQAAWQVDGEYSPPVQLARNGRWGAFLSGSRVDLIDATNGRCLGRCASGPDISAPLAFSLSPDSRRLIAMTKREPFTLSADGSYEFYTGTLWDLTTGSAETFPFGTLKANQFNDLHHAGWITPELFSVFMSGLSVYDIRAKGMVALFEVSENSRDFYQQKPWFRTAPDGRIWLHARGKKKPDDLFGPFAWIPMTLPEPAAPLLDPGRKYEEVARQPVRVEVDFQDAARSKRAAQAIADILSSRGYTIGDGPWSLRVTSEPTDRYASLGNQFGTEMLRIPEIRLGWSLVPPSGGAPVWTWHQDRSPLYGSSLLKGTRMDSSTPNQTIIKTEYDFGGRSPVKALTEEYLEKASRAPEVPGDIKGWALLSRGQGFALPLSGTCKVPLAR